MLPIRFGKVPNRRLAKLAIVGSFGIDTDAGLLGLIQYISAIAILLVTMGVTRDRSRADGVLFALTTATTIICLPIAELFVAAKHRFRDVA